MPTITTNTRPRTTPLPDRPASFVDLAVALVGTAIFIMVIAAGVLDARASTRQADLAESSTSYTAQNLPWARTNLVTVGSINDVHVTDGAFTYPVAARCTTAEPTVGTRVDAYLFEDRAYLGFCDTTVQQLRDSSGSERLDAYLTVDATRQIQALDDQAHHRLIVFAWVVIPATILGLLTILGLKLTDDARTRRTT